MRLVETDTALADDDLPERPRPPRPEHRKTYVSLLVTGAVLITTVALVYVLFPKRDHEVIGSVIDHHEDPGAFDLVRPSRGELAAWSLGVFGRSAPWPDDEALVIEGARRTSILKRTAALVRYRVGEDAVTVVAMQPWDAPPRTIRRTEGDLAAVWWRPRRWTMIAVGPAARQAAWRPLVGAP